jgi:hypothetical protein
MKCSLLTKILVADLDLSSLNIACLLIISEGSCCTVMFTCLAWRRVWWMEWLLVLQNSWNLSMCTAALTSDCCYFCLRTQTCRWVPQPFQYMATAVPFCYKKKDVALVMCLQSSDHGRTSPRAASAFELFRKREGWLWMQEPASFSIKRTRC